MAKTYEQLQRQIAALQAQAEKLRRKELDEVIGRIREAIVFYGLTADDLGLGSKPASKRRTGRAAAKRRGRGNGAAGGAARSAKTAATVLYRDENGNTWVGRGKRPQWLRDALAAGRSLEDFRVPAS